MVRVFIDGSAGTTGLRIRERLSERRGISLITLPEERRKDAAARAEALNAADVAFLCLPDAAAIEAAALVDNPATVVIDTSTAHRVAPGWTYGMPELPGARDALRTSKRIANPGCHASGFILLAAPLVRAGLLGRDAALSVFSLTGYSGGGKKMIAQYEADGRDPLLDAPRQYALGQSHKHLPEMARHAGVDAAPVFCPVVADFPSGMEVTVPLHARDLRGTPDDIAAAYREAYPAGGVVRFVENAGEDGFLSAAVLSGSDAMAVSLHGNPERLILVARYDNLGKGASGAAIQNMNIALGLPETEGLSL
ncbi:MAG: N-acetyl-gamma-glutamyl-phosphate reductase [Kiritimatiellae bacterium]|nr:N-acetyl-gamma-glutamyl-phosphate reductase [Kiritimatiellia bacterium]